MPFYLPFHRPTCLLAGPAKGVFCGWPVSEKISSVLGPDDNCAGVFGGAARYDGIVDVEGEVDGIMINFEIARRKFNVNAMTTELARRECAPYLKGRLPPNELRIVVSRGRGLKSSGGTDMPSTYVTIEARGERLGETRVCPTTGSPLWGQNFAFPISDPSTVIIIREPARVATPGSPPPLIQLHAPITAVPRDVLPPQTFLAVSF